MDSYTNNTTNGQYYYIEGNYVLISSNDDNSVNFNSDNTYNQYYTISNNFNSLLEPEIRNAHQVSYQEQYKNNYYFSNINNNLYNINTNLNTNNIINNTYDYKINQNQVYMPQNNNSNNYALVTPLNTGQNTFTNLNSTYIPHNTMNIPNQNISTHIDAQIKSDNNNSNNKHIVKIDSFSISSDKTKEKEKETTDAYNSKVEYDSIQLDKLIATEAVLKQIMKEESGDFLCPKCEHRLFGDNLKIGLEKWISRENNGINKIIFYGKNFMGYPVFYGKMEEKYYPEYSDSGDSCGIKRSIHFDAYTELEFKSNYSLEFCFKEAFTDKEWNKYLDNIMCLFCDYKSNFPDFIKDKKKQAKNK